jgi:regulator of replication initiation timing
VSILTEEDVYRIASRLPVEDANKLLTHFHSSTIEINELKENLRIHVQENKSITFNNDIVRRENEQLKKKNKIIVKFETTNHALMIENERLNIELEECKKELAFWLENSFKWSQKAKK